MHRARSVVFAFVGLVVLGAWTRAAGPPPRLYVPNQDDATVTVLDARDLEVVRTVDLTELGFGPNAKPHHAVVEPDGSHWYLSLIGENRILKFDAEDRIVGRAEFEVPGMMALHPTRDLLYVGRSMSAVNPPARIGVVHRSDMTVEEVEVFFPRPHAIAWAASGQAEEDVDAGERVYTASLAENGVAAVDPGGEVAGLTRLDGPVHTIVQFAVSPDGRWLVGTAELTGRLLVFDLTDPDEPSLHREVPVGRRPWHPVFTPDGASVWFGNKGSNTVSVIDTEGWEVQATLEHQALDRPHGSAVSPDGRRVFISNNGSGGSSGAVVVFDVATREVAKVVEVGRNAAGLGIRPSR